MVLHAPTRPLSHRLSGETEGRSWKEETMSEHDAFEKHIAEVERWVSGDDDRIAADLLRMRGILVAPADSLSDSRLRRALRELIDALAAEKIYLDCTDHFSDRELYTRLVDEVLPHSFSVGGDDFDLHDFSQYYDDATREAFLAYYATDEERQWAKEDDGPVPPKRALPYDRDRTLPRPANWHDYYV
jgi:hypothetical protein